MKTLSHTQHACLEAMGIDVWVSRNSSDLIDDTEPVIQTEVVATESIQANETKSVEIKPDIESADEESTTVQPVKIPTDWNGLQQAVVSCQLCDLSASRTTSIFGAGNQQAEWLIIGDAPSSEDDASGQIFTGAQGELLTAMLRAIGLNRQQVYLSNIVKCMPANNADATTEQTEMCLNYLKQQIILIKPKIILVLGQHAAQRLLDSHSTLARLRQKTHRLDGLDASIIVTYHPASLLSMPQNKRDAWHDLLFAQKTISAETVL